MQRYKRSGQTRMSRIDTNVLTRSAMMQRREEYKTDYVAPDGVRPILGCGNYKYAAPMVLRVAFSRY